MAAGELPGEVEPPEPADVSGAVRDAYGQSVARAEDRVDVGSRAAIVVPDMELDALVRLVPKKRNRPLEAVESMPDAEHDRHGVDGRCVGQ